VHYKIFEVYSKRLFTISIKIKIIWREKDVFKFKFDMVYLLYYIYKNKFSKKKKKNKKKKKKKRLNNNIINSIIGIIYDILEINTNFEYFYF